MISQHNHLEIDEEKKMPDGNDANLPHHAKNATTSTDLVLESMEDCVGCIDAIEEQRIFEEGYRKQAALQRQIAMDHGLSEAEAALIRLQMIDIEATKDAATNAADGIRSAVENTLSTKIITPQLDDILEQVCGVSNSASNACMTSSACETNDGVTNLPASVRNGRAFSCDVIDSSPLSTDLCDGVVLPMDTTLPTTLPGNDLIQSRQGKSARSLVDVAAEDDIIYEEDKEDDLTVDEGAAYECAICNDSSFSTKYPDHNDETTPSNPFASSPQGITMRKPIFCHLPCCDGNREPQGGKQSNFKVCTACILVLTVATKDGTSRVGRCPRCRGWISVLTLHSTSASMVVSTLETSGQCETCLQAKSPLILEEPATCDACFLATETTPLTYECEECHQLQSIESALYRSQQSSKTFGSEMCPCNGCRKSTHWRLLQSQLPFIPANDIPEEWGDDFLELARARVQTAREGIAKLDLPGRKGQIQPTKKEACSIM